MVKWNKYNDWLFLLARLLVGLMFAVHGLQKFGWLGGSPPADFATSVGVPFALVFVQGLLELLAGLSVAFGVWTRAGAVLGVVAMLSALTVAHFPNGWNPFTNGGEKALLYLAAFLVFWVAGSRKFSLK